MLDGSVSFDPSGVPGDTYYQWQCFMPVYPPRAVESTGLTSGPCLDFDLSPLSLPEAAVASIAADTMLMVPGDQDGLEHVITLTVQKVSFVGGVGDVRNSTAAISLYVVPGDPPEVFIDALKLPKAVSLPRPPARRLRGFGLTLSRCPAAEPQPAPQADSLRHVQHSQRPNRPR